MDDDQACQDPAGTNNHRRNPDDGPYVIMPGAMPDGPVTVPFVIYVGDERKIIGEATLEGDEVVAYITAQKDGILKRMLEDGLIQNVTMSFNTPPATPVYRDGTIRWVRNY